MSSAKAQATLRHRFITTLIAAPPVHILEGGQGDSSSGGLASGGQVGCGVEQ